ncbi:hypothetical protein C8Q76DRAFT_411347 [Earliella scabrosa]|nr:hypothetical protein C8Q76DRAFT_411347 [Earliella scabrosa]
MLLHNQVLHSEGSADGDISRSSPGLGSSAVDETNDRLQQWLAHYSTPEPIPVAFQTTTHHIPLLPDYDGSTYDPVVEEQPQDPNSTSHEHEASQCGPISIASIPPTVASARDVSILDGFYPPCSTPRKVSEVLGSYPPTQASHLPLYLPGSGQSPLEKVVYALRYRPGTRLPPSAQEYRDILQHLYRANPRGRPIAPIATIDCSAVWLTLGDCLDYGRPPRANDIEGLNHEAFLHECSLTQKITVRFLFPNMSSYVHQKSIQTQMNYKRQPPTIWKIAWAVAAEFQRFMEHYPQFQIRHGITDVKNEVLIRKICLVSSASIQAAVAIRNRPIHLCSVPVGRGIVARHPHPQPRAENCRMHGTQGHTVTLTGKRRGW